MTETLTTNNTITTTTAAATATTSLHAFSKPNLIPSPPRPLRFPSLSSNTTTTTTTLKPSKLIPTPHPSPPLPPPPPPPPPSPTHDGADFKEKALFLDSIGLDSTHILAHKPDALLSSASIQTLKSLKEYLSSFGFSLADLRRIIRMVPTILSLTPSDILPVFTFLLREVNVQGSDLRRVINSRPLLLVSNVDSQLRPTLYFLHGIGIHDLTKHVELLTSSVEERFVPKIEYFEKVGFEYRDVIMMFRRFPALFYYGIETNYEPKFNYFVVEMGRELRELRDFPQYFSFSLEKRIRPRHQRCVERGVCFPLRVMLTAKEDVFRGRLDVVCCGSTLPKRDSPLWCTRYEDDDCEDDNENETAL